VVEKRDTSFCSVRYVSSDRLDNFIIENLDVIRKNKQYLDSLVYVLNHNRPANPAGFEPEGASMPIMVENVQNLLQTIIDASKLKGKTEKRAVIKRHIEKVIYSKETIEVILLYSDSVVAASGPLRDPAAEDQFSADHNNGAACRHLSAPPGRPTSAMVCGLKEMARPVLYRASPLIIPFPHLAGAYIFPHSIKWRPLMTFANA
jgi:hypothetical protein